MVSAKRHIRGGRFDFSMCVSNYIVFPLSVLHSKPKIYKPKIHRHHLSIQHDNAHKYIFCNHICDIWNSLPSIVVDVSFLYIFVKLLNDIDFSQFMIVLY